MDQVKKLEGNFTIYVKIGEREYLNGNYKNAFKSFKKAHEVARELNRKEEMIKTLDTLVSCQEQLGEYDEAVLLTSSLISSFKASPVGYLRMGKLLRLKKKATEAAEFYRIGLKRASKRDPLYGILEKQSKLAESFITSLPPSTDVDDNGQLFSVPSSILFKLFKYMNGKSLKSLAATCNSAFRLVNDAIFTGALGRTDLKNLKSSQLYSKLLKEHCLLEKFSHSSVLSVLTESSSLLFLLYLRKYSSNSAQFERIKQLEIGPINSEIFKLFKEWGFGKHLHSLKVDVNGLHGKYHSEFFFNLINLRELCLLNYSRFGNDSVVVNNDNLEVLTILNSEAGLNYFYNCKHLKVLIYPNEDNLDNFSSDKLTCVYVKFNDSLENVSFSKPIKFLGLNGKDCSFVSKIDLNRYSNQKLNILHFDSFKFSYGIDIKNSNWNRLSVLRLNNVMFEDPRLDLTFILNKCRGLRALEIISVPLSNLNDFSSNDNGKWFIESLFHDSFSRLEHLILVDLNFGPSTLHLLLKSISSKDSLKYLKIFGFVNIQSSAVGYNTSIDQIFNVVKSKYPWTHLISTPLQFDHYNEIYNPFYK